jgi:hypothetical protein
MFGTRWVRFTRRNQVKNIPIENLRTAIINCGPQMLSGSFWKKIQKCQTAILKCRTTIFGLAARICSFKAIFSLKLIDFDTPSSQISLNCLERRSQARKKRKNTIGERSEGRLKNRARNRRSSWCNLFFTLFSCYTIV